jgi:hypothetical protein
MSVLHLRADEALRNGRLHRAGTIHERSPHSLGRLGRPSRRLVALAKQALTRPPGPVDKNWSSRERSVSCLRSGRCGGPHRSSRVAWNTRSTSRLWTLSHAKSVQLGGQLAKRKLECRRPTLRVCSIIALSSSGSA